MKRRSSRAHLVLSAPSRRAYRETDVVLPDGRELQTRRTGTGWGGGGPVRVGAGPGGGPA
ncbi:hypothetical protein ACFPM0_33610 [Pseudonocardia sulfidoxydans]|uniref:hypothetical protein n=1 Tax=Pseudonocardia sulfidoxydans TaxID=54011 RepID=UPI00360FE0A2